VQKKRKKTKSKQISGDCLRESVSSSSSFLRTDFTESHGKEQIKRSDVEATGSEKLVKIE
jgi:hypothetical protein